MNWRRLQRSSALCFGLVLLCACEITRIYQGTQIRADPNEWILPGQTKKGDVLRVFGPPDRVQRQLDGDIFIYSYTRRDSRKFSLEEPVITNTQLLTYTRVDEKADRLVVLFGKDGIVTNFGYRRGTLELPTGMTGRAPVLPDQPVALPAPPQPAPGGERGSLGTADPGSAVSATARKPVLEPSPEASAAQAP